MSTRTRSVLLLFSSLAAFAVLARAAAAEPPLAATPSAEGTWHRVEVSVDAGPDEAPASARLRALREARQRVAKLHAGVEVRQTLLVRSSAAGSEPARSVAVRELARGVEGGGACDLALTLSRERLADGEEVVVRLRSSRAAQVSLFGVDAGDRVAPLVAAPLPLAAGAVAELPGVRERARGVRLFARSAGGASASTEELRAIAVPDGHPPLLAEGAAAPRDVAALLALLARRAPGSYCEAATLFNIEAPAKLSERTKEPS